MAKAQLSPIQIKSLTLDALEFDRTSPRPESDEQGFPYDLDVKIEVLGSEESETDAEVRIELDVRWDPQPGPFKLSLGYSAHAYHDGTVEPDVFREVCRKTVGSMIVSFARPMVHRLMSEAGESFTLPLLDLRNLPRENEHDESEK